MGSEITPALQPWLDAHPLWTVVSSPQPGDAGRTRTELTRAFRFSTFLDAMAFMQAAAPFIDQFDHHPRWENVYRTVTVWLTTWDQGHTISSRDIVLAEHLDTVFDAAPRTDA